jgi:hypothetical protein
MPPDIREIPPARVRCPECGSRLEVIETPSGARSVSVVVLGSAVESTAHALERFMSHDAGPLLVCRHAVNNCGGLRRFVTELREHGDAANRRGKGTSVSEDARAERPRSSCSRPGRQPASVNQLTERDLRNR